MEIQIKEKDFQVIVKINKGDSFHDIKNFLQTAFSEEEINNESFPITIEFYDEEKSVGKNVNNPYMDSMEKYLKDELNKYKDINHKNPTKEEVEESTLDKLNDISKAFIDAVKINVPNKHPYVSRFVYINKNPNGY